MNRGWRTSWVIYNGVPRACGDEPLITNEYSARQGCSPRLRG